MENKLHLCLWFDGLGKAAADLYCSCFKNSKITADNGMVVMFELDGNKFMALNGGPMFKINPSISLFATCETIEATNELWDKLIIGGKPLMPIDKQPWSERYGWLQDKYGVTWQIMVVNEKGEKPRIRPAMLFTGDKLGKAEEAEHFYCKLFANSSVGFQERYPEGSEYAGKLMYSEFVLNGKDMIAMDGPGGHDYTFNEGISYVVDCETQQEIDYFWNTLTADGGKESMCGWLVDKYGVSWQIVPTIIGKLMTDKEKSGRVMQALLKMKKLDIEGLKNA